MARTDPALPGRTDGFIVASYEAQRSLVLTWRRPDGASIMSRFKGLPRGLSMIAARLVHYVMERRQLLGLARRVEGARMRRHPVVRVAAMLAGLALAGYATFAGLAWSAYGRPAPPTFEEADSILDRVMPQYDVAERFEIRVNAPVEITFAAARQVDLQQSTVIRAIFKTREWAMGAEPGARPADTGLVAETTAIGWSILAEIPGHEIVVGAVTQPWKADVVFRGLPADAFAAFHDPDFVKIVWTLRADPAGAGASIARTETRVATTDAGARAKFRRYWSLASPGIVWIRRLALRLVRADAERRFLRDPGV